MTFLFISSGPSLWRCPMKARRKLWQTKSYDPVIQKHIGASSFEGWHHTSQGCTNKAWLTMRRWWQVLTKTIAGWRLLPQTSGFILVLQRSCKQREPLLEYFSQTMFIIIFYNGICKGRDILGTSTPFQQFLPGLWTEISSECSVKKLWFYFAHTNKNVTEERLAVKMLRNPTLWFWETSSLSVLPTSSRPLVLTIYDVPPRQSEPFWRSQTFSFIWLPFGIRLIRYGKHIHLMLFKDRICLMVFK